MPTIFCRETRPSRWNPAEPAFGLERLASPGSASLAPVGRSRAPASPHPDYTLREWYVCVLVQAMPSALGSLLVNRFLPRQEHLSPTSETPLALPSLTRRGFAPGELSAFNDQRLCSEITLEAHLLDRTLSAPDGLVSGLSRNHLLVVHLIRTRQLWQEFYRRRWPGGWLPAYRKALG